MPAEKIGKAMIEEGASKVTEKDLEKVVSRSEDLKRRFSSAGPLQRFIDDGRLLVAIVKDYWSGTYRQVPLGTLGAVAFSLIYVLNPLDLVPDFLPIIGQVDDAAVIAACLFLVEHDLQTYRAWLLSRGQQPGQKQLPPPSSLAPKR